MDTTMRKAMEKAAENDNHLKHHLENIDKMEEMRKKKAESDQIQAELNNKHNMILRNKEKDIYIWRTKIHGMHYSVRSGFVFADSYDDAVVIVKNTYPTDLIDFIGKADISNELVETCMYIE